MKKRPLHVYCVDDLSDGDIDRLFFMARAFKREWPTSPLHKNAVLTTAFFESSTRTRLSFEMAAHRMGMGVTTFHAATSAMKKGEDIQHSLETIVQLRPDILVVRQSDELQIDSLDVGSSILINGGDGCNHHPSQALLDCFTLLERFGAETLDGRRIVIVGDCAHSRVANSNIRLLQRLGASVHIVAPQKFQPTAQVKRGETVSRFSELSGHFDAVMCLRVQKERMDPKEFVNEADFFSMYGLNKRRLENLGPACVVMHPGPMNLGIEIDACAAIHERSLIKVQAENGVYVRAALLDYLLRKRG